MKNIKPLTFPFNSENNTSIKQSLFRFREYFDSSTIVGLGENAHFIKEFFTFRHQVIEFLVTECDFDTLAFEFGFSEGLEVDKWIKSQIPFDDLDKLLSIQMSLKILCYGFVGIIKTIIIKLPF